jgi:hypothetical protein
MLEALLALALQAGPARPTASAPSAAPPGQGPVIIFLVDNSASLPPLDPDEKRVEALERMFAFLRGQRYRLVLFGGKGELSVDDPSRYRNDGRWTDFYHAFLKARDVASGYRKEDVRLVLLTDAIPDPDPGDWKDTPLGWDPRAHSIRKTVELVGEMGLPLYVILVGRPPADGGQGTEQSPGFVLDMVTAANGRKAAPLAQTLASFFADDGVLLRKFVYRVAPEEGLRKIEPVVQRIAAPPRPGIELRIFSYFLLPMLLILLGLLGLLVRSFPGPGDREIVELALGQPVHVAADRMHRLSDGAWSDQGLSLVADARHAAGSFTLQPAGLELTGAGLDTSGLDPRDAALLPLGLDEMRSALEAATDSGTREEKIHALNLDYAARSLRPEECARVVATHPAERGRVSAIDFVRAKVHLALDEPLRERLLAPRLHVTTYGKDAVRRELLPGGRLRLGRYRFAVRALEPGGRKDARLVLVYDRVPSLLGLKTVLPGPIQRVFRLRRSDQRIVT